MKKKKITIIGGGAAGLMAAGRAAELGANVTVLEKKDRPARKVAITGKGRCNVTTGHPLDKAVAAFGRNGRFLFSSFSAFYADDMIELLRSMGVPVKLERGKRYFPKSDSALDVADALVQYAKSCGARILTGKDAKEIISQGGAVTGVVVETAEEVKTFVSDAVILATGGLSYPATGSTGDGYRLARELGHTIVEPRASLVPFELKGNSHKDLADLQLKNVGVHIERDGKTIAEEFGEIKFMSYGVTGPCALDLGRTVAAAKDNAGMKLVINWKPALSEEQVDARLQREIAGGGGMVAEDMMKKLVPQQAIHTFLRMAATDPYKKAAAITKEERQKLVRLLTRMEFGVKGPRPVEEAIITAGGVMLKEINPRTMESKLVKGLYICGELLDIDAPTGGFNLQAAFSTGRAAGAAAAGCDEKDEA